MSIDFSTISAVDLQDTIETKWQAAAQKPNVLRYELKVDKERQTTGQFGFLIQVQLKFTFNPFPHSRLTVVMTPFS